jgi:hypothetical protein
VNAAFSNPKMVAAGPGTILSANLSPYSITLMPRNADPSTIVATRKATCNFRGALVCAARTASAIVSELTISTIVLIAPQMTSR